MKSPLIFISAKFKFIYIILTIPTLFLTSGAVFGYPPFYALYGAHYSPADTNAIVSTGAFASAAGAVVSSLVFLPLLGIRSTIVSGLVFAALGTTIMTIMAAAPTPPHYIVAAIGHVLVGFSGPFTQQALFALSQLFPGQETVMQSLVSAVFGAAVLTPQIVLWVGGGGAAFGAWTGALAALAVVGVLLWPRDFAELAARWHPKVETETLDTAIVVANAIVETASAAANEDSEDKPDDKADDKAETEVEHESDEQPAAKSTFKTYVEQLQGLATHWSFYVGIILNACSWFWSTLFYSQFFIANYATAATAFPSAPSVDVMSSVYSGVTASAVVFMPLAYLIGDRGSTAALVLTAHIAYTLTWVLAITRIPGCMIASTVLYTLGSHCGYASLYRWMPQRFGYQCMSGVLLAWAVVVLVIAIAHFYIAIVVDPQVGWWVGLGLEVVGLPWAGLIWLDTRQGKKEQEIAKLKEVTAQSEEKTI